MNAIHGRWSDATNAVTLMDAHHHLWDLRQRRHPWLSGWGSKEFLMGDYSPLQRDYLPQD
jgi:predicted TIM-barrel fold metal-dependent hydrolase